MKKRTGATLIALMLAGVFSFSDLASAENAPDEANAAARSGLPEFVKLIPSNERSYYGFADGDDLDRAAPGQPFRLYTITPDDLRRAGEGSTVSSLISPTGTWLYPVMLGDEIKCILTVARVEGSWKAAMLGSAPLARELAKVLARWPPSQGYEPRLVAVFQASAYFFAIPQKDDRNLTPFTFDGKGFGSESLRIDPSYASTVDLQEILAPLRSVVEDNLLNRAYRPSS
jgi:hypothetical protein